MRERNTSQLPRLLCCTTEKEIGGPSPARAHDCRGKAALSGQACAVRGGGSGAGGHLGKWAGSSWSGAGD